MGATKKSAGLVKVKKGIGRKLKGKTSGLSIDGTRIAAFKRATTEKWTDEKIASFMKSEFPDRKSKLFEASSVPGLRSAYNRGLLNGQTSAPATPNIAFDAHGQPLKRASSNGKAKAKRKIVVVKKK